MQFDWWTFAFQVINVLVLMWLLSRFMFRPIAGIIAERQAETTRALADAETAKAKAAEATRAAKEEEQRNASERLKIIEAAKAGAEAQRKTILDMSRKEAAEIAAKADADAKRKHRSDRQEQLRESAALAIRIAGRLMDNLPDDARILGYPERLQKALDALDGEQRNALASEPGILRIVAPRPLSDAELAATREAIRKALKIDPPQTVEVDASLIAGLELRGRHGIIHNSLSHDLSRIAEAMDRDDHV
ncbi:MAG: ATPase [Hoeflea sp.]|nr:ATPase [Hoeflea sp.]